MNKTRNSSIELLRICSIFIIILNHYVTHSSFEFNNNFELAQIIPRWFHIGGKLGVNIFIFISGYFLCSGNKFKINKLVKLILSVLFYSILMIIIGLITNELKIIYIVKLLLGIPGGHWEFITYYVILYFLSPYINIMLEHISLKGLLKIVLTLTFIWVILPSFFFVRIQNRIQYCMVCLHLYFGSIF